MTTTPEKPALDDFVSVLKASSARLHGLVEPLTPDQLRTSAYPTEWTIADVLSHIGSGAVIIGLRLASVLSGTDLADDFAQPIWDEWNAKSPEAQAADSLAADRALIAQIDELTDKERAHVRISFGPMDLDVAEFVGLRVNEHALHTWDIDVALHPEAILPADVALVVVDNIERMAGFVGKPTGAERTVHVRTSEPVRTFTIELGADAVSFTPTDPTAAPTPDAVLPAEAFVRLIYGRLDPAHTPAGAESAVLAELRRAYPGV